MTPIQTSTCKCGLERHDRTHLCESAEPCGLQTARLVLLRGGGGAGSANTAPAGRHHPRYLAFKMRMCRYWQRPGSSRLVFVLGIASMFAAILHKCGVWKVVRALGIMVKICKLPDKYPLKETKGSCPVARPDSISTPLVISLGRMFGLICSCPCRIWVILRDTPPPSARLRPSPLREPSCAGMPGRAFPCSPSPGTCAPGGSCTTP